MSFNKKNYEEISSFIKKNAQKPVKIVAVSKNHPLSSIMDALNCGIRVFGENRVQEARGKFQGLKNSHPDTELHLTGLLQTNKVKASLDIFDVFQTLDREKLVREFLKYQNITKRKKFFVQINIGKEKNKSGIMPEEGLEFVNYCINDCGMPVIGLMCIPPQHENPEPFFSLLKKIAQQAGIDNLSMGMSEDYKIGIMGGATHIRVGTYLFGKRNQ
ncbi:MAG: hypothetical protein CFH13_00940 [Alphaproteobacteria bacterium MarineAlpha5_Bin3]|jgi:pyridoxal phosphate enzyme (YggS family)|nr:MAG: hypothetical protein CFH13_00940 [Alphaproteobacteria bacterium MarineAlpha5_Bin3]